MFKDLNYPNDFIKENELANVLNFIRGCVEWFALPDKPRISLIDSIVNSMQEISQYEKYAILLHRFKKDPSTLVHFYMTRLKEIKLSF